MSVVEFLDYTNNNIKIINDADIKHPYQSFFLDIEEEYPIKKVYYNLSKLLLSEINIYINDCIYNAEYDNYIVYSAKINDIDKYVLKKGFLQSDEELVSEIKLQNLASKYGLSDPIFLAYILEDGKEYGLIMKKYEKSLFSIFDSEYYDIEDKKKYVDRIKIMLEDLSENVKICHGDFNLDNIMIDEEDNLKLVNFGKGCFIDNDLNKDIDIENFTNCNFYLDTISEQVTYDLQNYWYKSEET